ncbi:anaphase-promoting complex subunit 1 isoform X16 [Thraustotheca clavata]|uniref:Anaphase-promoting complex subunit 1 isoform X16 n=1 Tax=Thraustotheca clavata TaxID=74557 RepID=A0A1V9Z2L5_9STRA|nr:anaphase-promoting complex subunit 1 isoform X16 [Thraustotheca clavata]
MLRLEDHGVVPHTNTICVRGQSVDCTKAQGRVLDRSFRTAALDVAVDASSVCVLSQHDRLTCFAATGAVLDVPLPFNASSIFAMQRGILIERQRAGIDKSPMLFSLSDPLEEIKPVVLQSNRHKKCHFVADSMEIVVHVHHTPPFVLFYHEKSGKFCLRRIVASIAHEKQTKTDSILPEIVLESVWESNAVRGLKREEIDVFVATDVDNCPLLGIMIKQKQSLMLQRLQYDTKTQTLQAKTSSSSYLCCSSAMPLCAEKKLMFGQDLVVLELDHTLALYRGCHKLCKLTMNSPITSNPEIIPPQLPFGCGSPIAADSDHHMLDFTSIDEIQPAKMTELAMSGQSNAFDIKYDDGTIREFAVPISLTSWPLLEQIFELLNGTIDPLILAKWRIHILSTLNPWNSFQESLIPPSTVPEAPSSAFEKLLSSNFHATYLSSRKHHGQVPIRRASSSQVKGIQELEQYRVKIFEVLHLLYEDMKLSSRTQVFRRQLVVVLVALAQYYGWSNYIKHYATDFGPNMVDSSISMKLSPVQPFQDSKHVPVDIMAWLQQKIATHHFNAMEVKKKGLHRHVDAFPVLSGLTRTLHVTELYERLYPDSPMPFITRARNVVSYLAGLNWTWEGLPVGVVLPIRYAIYVVMYFPLNTISREECVLISRPDLLPDDHELPLTHNLPILETGAEEHSKDNDDGLADGLADVIVSNQQLYPKDQRLKEVARLLRSNRPMHLKIQRESHHTDADILSLQQARLLLLCKRSMALAVARGIVTLGSLASHTSSSVSTSPFTASLPIPQVPLVARVSGTNAKIVLDMTGYKDITHWPQFHNGVATALRLTPSDRVTVQWVLSHQPKPITEDSEDAIREYEEACAGHAGFLLGLGLQGHLQCQSPTTTYKYLSLGHELTSVGFLLGTAASTLHHSKDMNIERAVSKMLSMHIPSLWPPSFSHLHVPPSAQTAAILGIGILHQSTGHRLMTEFLLTEMTQGPAFVGPPTLNSTTPSSEAVQYEGYALATGFALGLILLGRRNDPGLVDLDLDAKLTKCMIGGEKDQTNERQAEQNCILKTRKKQHRECINVDVSASGSAFALAFAYMWSNNPSIAQRLQVPSTLVLLEAVRPDVLFVRVVAANLVLWDSIEPTVNWVLDNQLPAPLRPRQEVNNSSDATTVQEAYANIVAGACFSISLRFAGTHHPEAKATLLFFINEFQQRRAKPSRDMNRVTLERVLGTLAQCLALVMVGTGDVDCMRLLRGIMLRQKADAFGDVTYGNHMATSSAMGLLFLGGGRYSIKTTKLAIAMLVISLYPMYPTKTTDQRYHMQALRHLYVLAIDRTRLVRAMDVDTQQLISIPFKLWTTIEPKPLRLHTPFLLPTIELLQRLQVDSADHFPIEINWQNQDARVSLLSKTGILRVKRKQGAHDRKVENSYLDRFHQLFSTKSDAMWPTFLRRLVEECQQQNKPDIAALYLNAKLCEQDLLAGRIQDTLMVANLQLMQLHMELEAHTFQQQATSTQDTVMLAQLINEDFILGCSNALLSYFERLDMPKATHDDEEQEFPLSLIHAAFLRYLGSPSLTQLE